MTIAAAFLGTLGKDAEAKTSSRDKPFLRLSVRVGDGPGAQWITITSFDESAVADPSKFLKGAAVYTEGTLRLDTWTSKGGTERHGLTVMSWHTRLAQIGRNKQKRTRHTGSPSVAAGSADFGGGTSQAAAGDMDDEIPF